MREQTRGVLIKKHLYPVEFKYDSVEFTQAGEQWAEKIAQCLREKQLSGITLIGHTDDRGDEAYNKKLSLRRAEAVEKYLVKQGLNFGIETEGRGEEEPIKDPPPGVAQGDEEYYQLNRRVEMLTY
jgi:OOP family OmpA-OmpF porin